VLGTSNVFKNKNINLNDSKMTVATTVYKLINYYTQRYTFPHKGWKYFHRWLKFWQLDRKEYRKKLSNDTFIFVTPSDHIQQQLFWYGNYEKPVGLLLEKLTQPGSVVIDIGANIGYFTLVAAQKATKGKVFSFEPVQQLFEKLKKNIEENKLANTEIFLLAIGDVRKDSVIYISSSENIGMSSLSPPENFSGVSQSIQMNSLDNWIKTSDIKKADIIKLDIEGSELSALKGMKETLIKFKPALIVEINPETLSYFDLAPSDILDYLKNLDYLPFHVSENGFLSKMEKISAQENITFIHSSKIDEYDRCFP
jgi:FkbM family methyltransferase